MGEKCAHKEKLEVYNLTPLMEFEGVDNKLSNVYWTS